MNVLKSFGYGLLYFVLFPFIVAASALVGIYALINLFIQGTMAIIHFFSGREVFPDFDEDKEAKRRIDIVTNMDPEPKQEEVKQNTSNVYVQNNYYQDRNAQPQQQQQPQPEANKPQPQAQYYDATYTPEDRQVSYTDNSPASLTNENKAVLSIEAKQPEEQTKQISYSPRHGRGDNDED